MKKKILFGALGIMMLTGSLVVNAATGDLALVNSAREISSRNCYVHKVTLPDGNYRYSCTYGWTLRGKCTCGTMNLSTWQK
jgi:hypothetical protein